MGKASIFTINTDIPQDMQNEIENTLLSINFPWYSLREINSPVLLERRNGFQHAFLDETLGINSPWIDMIQDIAETCDLPTIIRSKAFLQIPLNNLKIKPDKPHFDHDAKYMTHIYYVKDSDGDILFYKDDRVIERYSPKKGELITFRADTLHTPLQPQLHSRCIINIITLKDKL